MLAPNPALALSATYANTIERLSKATTDFVETGLARFTYDRRDPKWWKAYSKTVLLFDGSMSKYLRHVARDLKRPYVKVGHCIDREYDSLLMEYVPPDRHSWFITVPRRNYTAPLVSVFILAAKERYYSARQSRETITIVRTNNSVNEFRLAGDDGRVLFEHWLTQCRDDPDFRKALRLPPQRVTIGGYHG